jgi:hypothetical protein
MYIHINQINKIMKKQFIVIEEGNDDYYVVEDLSSLINEMYECELEDGESFDEVSSKFYSIHKVIEVIGEIKELN